MARLRTVLVLDDFAPSREALALVLEAHCDELLLTASLKEARKLLRDRRDLSLVLCDASVEGGGAHALASLAGEGKGPPVVVVTARPSAREAHLLHDKGALGYLSKPLSFKDIAHLLRRTGGRQRPIAPRVRRPELGVAYRVAAHNGSHRNGHGAWPLRDLSLSGAFLETTGPLPVGERVDLALVLGADVIRVEAEVVRIQEPSWDHAAGIGVAFQRFEDGTLDTLAHCIERARI
ncbi:MAG: response regulator [Proteobacteria bacterium]|nr:response regulator [Pseudomonadota bacterium]